MITISAFKWVPPFPQGLVRDLRVRWALEGAVASPFRYGLACCPLASPIWVDAVEKWVEGAGEQ